MSNIQRNRRMINNWLARAGFPDVEIEWAISKVGLNGRLTGWKPFLSHDELPIGERVLFRKKDTPKGPPQPTYYTRAEVDNFDETGPGLVSDSEENDTIQSEEIDKIMAINALKARERAIEAKEKELRDREDELRDRDADLNKKERAAINEQAEVSAAFDRRVKAHMEILQQWDQKNREAATERREFEKHIDSFRERLERSEEKHAIASSITYIAERAGGFAAIAKVKAFNDVPAEMVEDFQKYLKSKAMERYFSSLPLAGRRVFNDWLHLGEKDKQDFMQCCKNYYQDKFDQEQG